LRSLLRLHDALTRLSLYGGTVALGVIVVSYCYEVFARYIFNAPTLWANEAVSYALCIGVFLMMPYVTAKGGHVAVTVLVDVAPPKVARLMIWLTLFMGFLVCGFSAWVSLDENVRQIVQDVRLMKVYAIPKWWISVFITYGFASSALYFLRMLGSGNIGVDAAASLERM
jgi:C4-dicarboxylate transporter, DctQ subunit